MTNDISLTSEEWRIVRALKITGALRDGKFYRMRLFNRDQRHALREAMHDPTRRAPFTAEGCSGMADELEMVNFDVYGLSASELVKHRA